MPGLHSASPRPWVPALLAAAERRTGPCRPPHQTSPAVASCIGGALPAAAAGRSTAAVVARTAARTAVRNRVAELREVAETLGLNTESLLEKSDYVDAILAEKNKKRRNEF